ncbi:MAG: putative metal-dependent hydrolase [Ignavibacteriae bacterium]|nr:putative metal-dependent hydrolase [Ignavibacteriota bacterium]
MDLEKLKYPIGRFTKPEIITSEMRNEFIDLIKNFPNQLKNEVENLSDEQLNTQYRPDGWTIRQVVNHCADSHMNSLIRFKLALTEDTPTIKPYLEDRWAKLEDSKNFPISSALKMIEGIHERWTALLNSFSENDWNKCFYHPQSQKEIKLDENLSIYAWHCKHHLAHITELKKSKNW